MEKCVKGKKCEQHINVNSNQTLHNLLPNMIDYKKL